MFKKSKIHLLIVPIGIGKLIPQGLQWRYAVSLAAIGSPVMITENGLGEYDRVDRRSSDS